MEVVGDILRDLVGKIHFMIFLGKKPAAEILLENKEIIVDIKNPLIAIELGIEEFLSKKKRDINMLKKIKRMGYTIRIKYKMFEVDI